MNIGITGSTGFIGKNLIPELLKENHRIRVLVRDPQKSIPWRDVEKFHGDFHDIPSLKGFIEDLDIIVHCAGVIKALKPEDFVRGNYESTKNLIDAINEIRPQNLRKFIFLSSQSAQGPSNGLTPKKVEHEPHPVSWYGKSKLMAENYIINNLQFPYYILRLASVYGPYDTETLRFFKYVKTGLFPLPGGEKYLHMIYVKDVVKLIAFLISQNLSIYNKIYFVAYPEPVTLSQIIDAIKTLLGKNYVIKIPIPSGFVKTALKLNEIIARIRGKVTIANSDKAQELIQKYWIGDPRPLIEETGFKPQYSLIEGIYETFEWYKNQGWI
ncbi:MAG: NAD-dependent epimerase/dehydratase family protein [Candidatus Hydrothermia bacterium]